MIKKRINTDLPLSLTLLNKDGSVPDLSKAYDITVAIINSKTKAEYPQTYTLANNVLTLQYSSVENTELGFFNVRFGWKEKSVNSETEYYQYYIDFSYVFQIVPISEDEDGTYAKMTGTVSVYGADGLSAYELAVKNGYAGTESAWLESLKLHYADLTTEEIAILQQPATDAATACEKQTADCKTVTDNATTFEAAAEKAELSRVSAETTREQNESAREQADAARESNEVKRVSAETARDNAEKARAAAETKRESDFSASKTACDNATNNANSARDAANTAAAAFGNTVVQTTGTDTAKVISQKIVTDELAKKVDKVEGKGLSTNDYDNTEKAQVSTNKETNILQDTVTAEALAKLINEVNALKKIIASGKLGDIHVASLTSDTVPQYCEQQMIIKGSGSPVTNAVTPDFEGQIYVDTTNRNAYMCCDSSSASYWKQLN
jgi:hypothetical protein